MSIHLDFGISPKTFRQTYLYQKPKLFKGAVRNLEAASWKDINEIYQRADPTAPLFHLRKKVQLFLKKNTSKVSTIWAKLATVLLNPLSTNI